MDLLKNKDILEEHRKNLKNLQDKVLKKSITKTDIFLMHNYKTSPKPKQAES